MAHKTFHQLIPIRAELHGLL